MPTFDIFNSDAFSMVQLTAALEKTPFKPALLGSLGIFEDVPIRTTSIAIEKRDGVLSLIQTSNRGAPLDQRARELRDIRNFNTARIAKSDTIQSHELQNVRGFGSETEMEAVQAEVMRRYAGPTGILRDVELTHEYMRLGAIQGVVLDADGSTIINWYTQWGASQAGEIDFDLDTATTNVRGKCASVIRAMMDASKGAWLPGTQVHALCGDGFYDALIDHAKVRDSYLNWAEATDLRRDQTYGAFNFGGITFHNYRGTDNFVSQATVGTGGVGIDSAKAKFFPVGAPGVFQAAWSPAEGFDFVNTLGRPVYGMIVPDPTTRNAWVSVEAYSYPLFICTRPEMLQRAGT